VILIDMLDDSRSFTWHLLGIFFDPEAGSLQNIG
jgi:hypothetical protein